MNGAGEVLMPLRPLCKICTTVMLLVGASLVGTIPADAATIPITYSFSGVGTVTGMTSTTLNLTAAATGSIDEFDLAKNAVWNPVTYTDVSQLNLSTGLLNGTFTMIFANGEMLSGTVSENQSMVNPITAMGPFTQTLTFTGGTGEFAGISGSVSGVGFVTPTNFTISGNGTLAAPGLTTPEPGSIALMLGGLLLLTLRHQRKRNN